MINFQAQNEVLICDLFTFFSVAVNILEQNFIAMFLAQTLEINSDGDNGVTTLWFAKLYYHIDC